MWVGVESQSFLLCLTGAESLLFTKFLVFLGCHFLGCPLTTGDRIWGALFLYTYWCFWVAIYVNGKYGVYKVKKKTHGKHHCTVPHVLRSSANLPSHRLSGSQENFILNVQAFNCIQWKEEEKQILHLLTNVIPDFLIYMDAFLSSHLLLSIFSAFLVLHVSLFFLYSRVSFFFPHTTTVLTLIILYFLQVALNFSCIYLTFQIQQFIYTPRSSRKIQRH